MHRSSIAPRIRSALAIASLGTLGIAAPATAQLRPLDPVAWTVLQSDRTTTASVGLGLYSGQTASLAGTRGRLIEVGNLRVHWRAGPVVIEAAGTVRRTFHDEVVIRPPDPQTRPPTGEPRHDAGAFRIATIVPLLSPGRGTVVLRFGTRLPTTDNRIGLDRDRTDFFALVGGAHPLGRFRIGGEIGLGIHGTRHERFEQVDVLLYSGEAAYAGDGVRGALQVVGQKDGLRGWTLRGGEDLSEARLVIRAGSAYWIEVVAIAGLAEVSPATGLQLSAGFAVGGTRALSPRPRRPRPASPSSGRKSSP